ncbi:serine/threonine protein kinase, partial [Hyalangium minutum]|uniref:serine/threonine protein kinase n=1 Tax=Hyalangium minutum TaxID=394096 RepID=UPI0005C65D27
HARTLREVLVLLMLDHPNIVKPRAFGYLPDGRVYFVLEYVDGWTLEQWVERTHPTAQEIARVFMKIAGAVAYLHGKGVKHRDLKLKNVLIRREDGEPILIDFGAATYEHAEELTGAGLPPGTDRFRAPEALGFLRRLGRAGKERYSFQVADEIFSLGVMLYDVLTDPRPTEHKGKTPLNSPTRLIPFSSPQRANPRVPIALSDTVMNLLELDPKHRPENMEAVRRELAEFAEHPGSEYAAPVHLPSEQRAPAPEGAVPPDELAELEPPALQGWPQVRAVPGIMLERIRRWPKPWVLVGVVSAVVLALAAASGLLREGHPSQPPQAPPGVATTPGLPPPLPVQPPVNVPAVSAPAPPQAAAPLLAAPATPQKEGSTVKSKPPDALKPTRNVRGQSSAPAATDPTFPAWCRAVTLTAAMAAGCTGAQLRPEPFECPPGA